MGKAMQRHMDNLPRYGLLAALGVLGIGLLVHAGMPDFDITVLGITAIIAGLIFTLCLGWYGMTRTFESGPSRRKKKKKRKKMKRREILKLEEPEEDARPRGIPFRPWVPVLGILVWNGCLIVDFAVNKNMAIPSIVAFGVVFVVSVLLFLKPVRDIALKPERAVTLLPAWLVAIAVECLIIGIVAYERYQAGLRT
ncbi:MAG: hypothetical protein ACYTAF_09560 [Planctomycetota bacterium]|jgi:hypothetical protein